MMNDNGCIDERCIADSLKLSGVVRPQSINDLAPLLASMSGENHVSVLVNLLRMSIIKSSKPSDFVVKPTDLFYDDGHINISYENFLKRDFGGWQDPDYSYMSFNITRYDDTTILAPGFYCPNLENLTSREFNIFCTLIGEINFNYPLRIAFSSPALTQNLVLPPRSKHSGFYEVVNDFTVTELNVILRKYVFANRVHSDFDLAYLIVVQSLFAPLPRAAEANGWLSPVGNITLPYVESVRGFLPQMTQGSPYEPHPDRLLTWAGYTHTPKRLYTHAISACEAFYTGLFEILTANPAGVEDSLALLGMDSFTNARPYKMFCNAASYRFGKEFDLLWDTNAGVDCYSHLLATSPLQIDVKVTQVDNSLYGYQVYETFASGERTTHLVCRELKPALFPILSMGINDDRYFNNSLEYSTKLYYNEVTEELTTTSSDHANKAMSLFRLGGFDATLIDGTTGRAMRNWAANSNGQVVPVLPPGIVGASTYKFPTRFLNKRKNSWMDLPNVVGELTMTAKIKIKGYVILQNGKFISNFLPAYRAITVYPKALSSESMTTIPMKTDPTALKYRYKGFTLAASQQNAPVVHLQSSPMDTIDSQPVELYHETDGAPETA